MDYPTMDYRIRGILRDRTDITNLQTDHSSHLNPDQRSGYQCHLDTPNVNYQDMGRDWLLVRYKPCKPFH